MQTVSPIHPVATRLSVAAQADVLRPYGGGWQASLRVDLACIEGRSVATRVEHAGPLRIQKVLWPEGPSLAHLILLHPPGGLAAGDTLALALNLADEAACLLTTPGAGRWYRADAPARQSIAVSVGVRGSLEWLPQETVLHDGVQGHQQMSVDIDPTAVAIGIDMLVLGRRASGERLDHADFCSRLTLRRGTRLLFDDVSRIGMAERGVAALGEAHVSGLLWAVSPTPLLADLADAVEAAAALALGAEASARGRGLGGAIAAASVVDPHLLLVRAVGSSPERIRAALVSAWSLLRPLLIGRAAVKPRIWMT